MKQKKKGKLNDLISTKSKVIIAHDMWMILKEFGKNSTKTKTTLKEKWKGKTCGGYAHSLSKHIFD
jgi:hypothetical protein